MFHSLKKWLIGQILINIKGASKDRLLNMCKKNDIPFENLKLIDDGYSMQLSTSGYKELMVFKEKIKSDCTIEVVNKIGLPHFFFKYKKRKIFAICCIIFLISVYCFTYFIWNISISGTSTYTKEEIIKDVKNNHVKLGSPKSDINCNELEKQLRNKYDNLAWISCQIKGTNLIINVEETVPNNEVIKYEKPCNIIAHKDAIITKIVTNKGSRVVNLGDKVNKNDILITGAVNVYNEYDELLETNYLSAKGQILGIVEYNYYDEFSLENSDKVYTNNTTSSYSIYFKDSIVKLPFCKAKYNSYDTVTEDNKLKLFGDIYLPLGIYKTTYKEYDVSNVTLSQEEASAKAKERLIIYIDNLKKKGVSILENNVTISFVDGKCIAKGIIKCEESIGIPSELEIIKEEEQIQ